MSRLPSSLAVSAQECNVPLNHIYWPTLRICHKASIQAKLTLPAAAAVLVHDGDDDRVDHKGIPSAALLVVRTRIQDRRGKGCRSEDRNKRKGEGQDTLVAMKYREYREYRK